MDVHRIIKRCLRCGCVLVTNIAGETRWWAPPILPSNTIVPDDINQIDSTKTCPHCVSIKGKADE